MFINDYNDDLIYLNGDDGKVYKWNPDPSDSRVVLSTKDFDFGSPAKIKKVYSFIMTYQLTGNDTTNNKVYYLTDGANEASGTSWTAMDGIAQANGQYDIYKHIFSTPISCQSIRFKVDVGSSSATQLNINDITIGYRELHKRVS